MGFSSNTDPRKFGKPKRVEQQPWVCGCKRSQPKYVLFCKRCGKGQSKKNTKKD